MESIFALITSQRVLVLNVYNVMFTSRHMSNNLNTRLGKNSANKIYNITFTKNFNKYLCTHINCLESQKHQK